MMKSDGITLFSRTVGAGLPCLSMHGLGFDHTLLSPWLDAAPGYQMVYYDQRHSGRSSRVSIETVTLETLTSDAERLRLQLGVKQVAVLGHSSGALIALEYALRYPQSVRHLLLLNPFPAWVAGFDFLAQAEEAGATPEMLSAFDFSGITSDHIFRIRWETVSPLYFADRHTPLRKELGQNTIFSHQALKKIYALLVGYDGLSRARKLQVPTLIMTGRHDFIATPSHTQTLASAIPMAKLHIFPHSAHFPYAEESECFASMLTDWQRMIK